MDEVKKILDQYGICQPDHRADIAEAVWNAAIDAAIKTITDTVVVHEGTDFGSIQELRSKLI